MPGVVCSPHLGASTEEAQTNVAVEGAGLLIDYLTTARSGTRQHARRLIPKRLAALRGYMDVAYRLGLLCAAIRRFAVRSCRLLYRGEVASKETKLLSATFAAGFCSRPWRKRSTLSIPKSCSASGGLNSSSNAPGDGGLQLVITAEVVTERGVRRAAGTLFGHEMARLVQLGEHRLDAYLDGTLLVFTHHDVPGIIGGWERSLATTKSTSPRWPWVAPRRCEAIGVLNLDTQPQRKPCRRSPRTTISPA